MRAEAIAAVRALPALREESDAVVRGVAALAWQSGDRGRRHNAVPGAFSAHCEELEELFGRGGFARLCERCGLLRVRAEACRGSTRALEWTCDVPRLVTAAVRAADAAQAHKEWINLDGTIDPRILRADALHRMSLGTGSIWRSASRLSSIAPVSSAGLDHLDELLAVAARSDSAERARRLEFLDLEANSDIERIRAEVTKLKAEARTDLVSGSEFVCCEYREASTGRLFEVGCGLQGARSVVRRAAMPGCWEYDVESCHAAIIVNLATQLALSVDALADYVAHKDQRREEIAASTGLTYRQAKDGLIKLTYGSRERASDAGEDEVDAITRSLGNERAAAFFDNDTVKALQQELARIGRKIEEAAPKERGGSLRNAAGCCYVPRDRKGRRRKNTWSARLSHLVQGIEVRALHAVVTAGLGGAVCLLAHDGWTSRERMDVGKIEGVIGAALGFRLAVKEKLLTPLPRI